MVYEIEYSKRRKTVGILVERDRRVIVKAPEGFPASRIQEIVEKKKGSPVKVCGLGIDLH